MADAVLCDHCRQPIGRYSVALAGKGARLHPECSVPFAAASVPLADTSAMTFANENVSCHRSLVTA